METLSKIEALKYMCKIGPSHTDEWSEAGMYHSINEVINSDEEYFEKEYLDKLLERASNF